MSIAYGEDEEDFFGEAESRLIQSYCKRNGAIPILVANGWVGNDTQNHKTDKTTNLSLLPKLFGAANQALRTAPNAMLMGWSFCLCGWMGGWVD